MSNSPTTLAAVGLEKLQNGPLNSVNTKNIPAAPTDSTVELEMHEGTPLSEVQSVKVPEPLADSETDPPTVPVTIWIHCKAKHSLTALPCCNALI